MSQTALEKLLLRGGAAIPGIASAAALATDASGNVIAAAAASTAPPDIQNGVVNSGDAAVSGISLATGTGALTFTLAAASVWINNTSGVLVSASIASGATTLTPGALPASARYAVYGLEADTSGALSLVKGADTVTQLNTGTLIAANSPAVTSGRLRLADFALWNNAGTINFSNATTVASQGVNWIDRRPWARGAFVADQNTGAFYSTTTTTFQPIDNTYFQKRVECSGVPIRVRLFGSCTTPTTSGEAILACSVDNSLPAGTGFAGNSTNNNSEVFGNTGGGPATFFPGTFYDWAYTPSAGSHLFTMVWGAASATAVQLGAHAPYFVGVSIEEIVRANVANGTA